MYSNANDMAHINSSFSVRAVSRTEREIYGRYSDSANERACDECMSIVSDNRLRQIDDDLCALKRVDKMAVVAAAADIVHSVPIVRRNYSFNTRACADRRRRCLINGPN